MARKTTPSFVHELSLMLLPKQIKELDKRLDVARQIYNACLGESFRRLKRLRESKTHQKTLKATGQARQSLFRAAHISFGFREYDLHHYVKQLVRQTWLSEHIDSATAQKLATRAFKAVKEYSVGKRGRPRFRSNNRFSSVESKSNKAGIRWQDGKIKWKKLELMVKFDKADKHGLEAYALSCRTKYVRLVRRVIRGKSRWYAQLIQEGTPYVKSKNQAGSETIGLDIGPSTIAVVGETKAELKAFCPEVVNYHQDIKVLQKQLSRSQRATNPHHFEPDGFTINPNGRKIKKLGKIKKGAKNWIRSQNYLATQRRIAELQRKMAETRKRAQGECANEILKLGKIIKTENLSYKAFQKNFGYSVSTRAPGLFLEKLRYKAANAGGEVMEFSTRTTALSQTCQCGCKAKKHLKERWHTCATCGVVPSVICTVLSWRALLKKIDWIRIRHNKPGRVQAYS